VGGARRAPLSWRRAADGAQWSTGGAREAREGERRTVGAERDCVHGQVEAHGEALELHRRVAEHRHHPVLRGRGEQVARRAGGQRRLGYRAAIHLPYVGRVVRRGVRW
jgi:hypothetical protein